jgi:hypothetical protein
VPADVKKESVEEKQMNLFKDKTGKIRTFMLRAAAAREAHTKNGTVIPYKNGYAINLMRRKMMLKFLKELLGIGLVKTENHPLGRNL